LSAEASVIVFSRPATAETNVRQLKSGSLVLVDVVAGKTVFRGSISAKGVSGRPRQNPRARISGLTELGRYGPPRRMLMMPTTIIIRTPLANMIQPHWLLRDPIKRCFDHFLRHPVGKRSIHHASC